MPTTTSGGSRQKRGPSGTSGANGKVKTVKVKNLRFTIPQSVPVGTLRAAFKDETTNEDVVKFLNNVLGEEQMERFWALDLDLADGPIGDQVVVLLEDLWGQVQNAIGLKAGE